MPRVISVSEFIDPDYSWIAFLLSAPNIYKVIFPSRKFGISEGCILFFGFFVSKKDTNPRLSYPPLSLESLFKFESFLITGTIEGDM